MASKILCSCKFCDTKQMGRGERSLCNHITYPTERKTSQYTCALLNCSISRKYNLCHNQRKKLQTKHMNRQKACTERKTAPRSGTYEVTCYEGEAAAEKSCLFVISYLTSGFLGSRNL